MKSPADEPGGEEKGERIKAYTVQLWPADMQFLENLATERNESAGELRRRALRVGKLIIATETPPKNGKYGETYTPADLAKELANSTVVQAIQFAERQGISLVTIPATFYEGLERAITHGITAAISASGGLRVVESQKQEEVLPEPEEDQSKKPPLLRPATLRRHSFRNDAKI